MQRIVNQRHTIDAYLYAFSRMLERAAYYGIRFMLVLYMIGESLNLSREEALSIYAKFTAAIIFAQLFGALLGDLVVGNKKAIIIGGIIQSIGAFVLCVPSTTGLYAGLGLIVLGGGLYTPNIIAQFGKLYSKKEALLDSGFTIFYLAVNLGAFIGTVAFGYLGEQVGWNYGFMVAGIAMLCSVVYPVLHNPRSLDKYVDYLESKIYFGLKRRIGYILIAIVLGAAFWTIYEIASIESFDVLQILSETADMSISMYLLGSFNSVLLFIISIIAIILWAYIFTTQFVKIAIGFICLALSVFLLITISQVPIEQQFTLYMLSILFLGIAEINISPIILSIITQYSNPKYLALVFSLSFLPAWLSSLLISTFMVGLYDNPISSLKYSMIAILTIILVVIFIALNHKKRLEKACCRINKVPSTKQ